MPEWVTNEQLQGLVALIVGGIGVYFTKKGQSKSDGKPPPDREPSTHEVRAMMASTTRILEDLSRTLDKHVDRYNDDKDDLDEILNDVKRVMNDLNRGIDRLEAAQRLAEAVAGIRRELGNDRPVK